MQPQRDGDEDEAATSGIAPITSQARTRVPIGQTSRAVQAPIDSSINAGTSPQGTSRHAAPLTFERAIHASSCAAISVTSHASAACATSITASGAPGAARSKCRSRRTTVASANGHAMKPQAANK